MENVRRLAAPAVTLALVWSIAAAAAAQAPPATGPAHAERVAERHNEDDIRLSLTAGSALTYGNARNLAVNLGANFALRLDQHSLAAQLGWVYGIASTRDSGTFVFGDWADSANNLTWKLRYDFFITGDSAVFLVHTGRRDPFAQLEPRIGFQAGYLQTFFREQNHRFWGEIGYDFTFDSFSAELQVGTDVNGAPILSRDRVLHSLRFFIGYDNRLNEVLTYTTGLEALMRLDRPEHWRFEWINQLRSKLADWLQVSLDLTGRLDSLPPGQAQAWNEQAMQPTQMLDVLVTLNLVGTFDMYSPPAQEEEDEDECECPEPTCPPAEADAAPPAPAAEAAPEPAQEASPEEAPPVE